MAKVSEVFIGAIFGQLTVIELTKLYRGKYPQKAAICRCDCGITTPRIAVPNLGINTTSCGCAKQGVNRTHGMSNSPTYKSWSSMVQRCTNPKYIRFKDYGGRGVTVSEPWLVFENFLADMGERPEGKTLDREDNELGYSKDNCQWSTRKEQMNNTRRTLKIQHSTLGRITLVEAAKLMELQYGTVTTRLRAGKSVAEALESENFSLYTEEKICE